MPTVIDSLLISLGFSVNTAGLDDFKKKAESASTSLLSYGAAAGAVLGGIAVKAVADIGDKFEQNTIALAGFFDALGISSSFNAGLEDASRTLDKITIAAAKLPGEADDYIEVFRAGLAGIKGAMPSGTVDEMVEFSNTFAAVGKSLGIDAGQIGRDLSLLLGVKGHAGADVRTFQKMLPFIMQVKGQAGLTAESFNKLSQAARMEVLQKSFVKLQPMLDASADSFDAMKGAVISAAKTMIRVSSVGLFKGMKEALKKINAVFFDAKGVITATGQKVVDFGRTLSGMVTQTVSSMGGLVEWLIKNDAAMAALKGTAVLLGLAMAGLAFEKVAKGVGTLFYALTNLKRLFTGALVVAIGLVAEDLYVFATGGESVTGMLVEKFGPAAKWLAYAVLPALGAALLYVNRQAVGVALALARPVLPLVLIGAAVYGVTRLWKAFGEKGKAAMVFVGAAAVALFVYMRRAAIQTAIGFALMNAPLVIMIATLAALGAAIYYVVTRWDQFGAGAKVAIIAVTTVLGTLLAAFLAVKAAAITAALTMAAAWVAANLPIAIGIVLIGLMAVGIYELVKHWDEVTNAIDNAIDALARFFHISDDATGRKGLAGARAAFEAKTKGFGAPTKGRDHNDGESTDFLKKKPKGAGEPGAPAAAGSGVGVMDKLKGLLPPGMDLGALMGMPGGAPATAGGPALPPGIFDLIGGKGGGSTHVTNTQTTNVGGINVDARGLKDADDVARKVDERLKSKTQRTIRNAGSGFEY